MSVLFRQITGLQLPLDPHQANFKTRSNTILSLPWSEVVPYKTDPGVPAPVRQAAALFERTVARTQGEIMTVSLNAEMN